MGMFTESVSKSKREAEDVIEKISKALPGQISKVIIINDDGTKHRFTMNPDHLYIKEQFHINMSKIRFQIADRWNKEHPENKIQLDGSTGNLR